MFGFNLNIQPDPRAPTESRNQPSPVMRVMDICKQIRLDQ